MSSYITPDFTFDNIAVQVDSSTNQEDLLRDESAHTELSESCDTGSINCECSKVYHDLCIQLKEAGQTLSLVLSDSDPLFVQTGRELRAVATDTRELIDTMHSTAALVNSKAGKGDVLKSSGELIDNLLEKLDEHKQGITNDLSQVNDLVTEMSGYRSINDTIGSISASFRAVRVNILIQCNAQHISEDIFQDVTEDIESLSKTLKEVGSKIRHELSYASKNLSSLEKTVTTNQTEIDQLAGKAREVVTNAYDDIRRLMLVAETMIDEASSRSILMAKKVDEIVVSIQFHDSLSQRAEHILQSFEDIADLYNPANGDVSPEHLGSAYMILDLQHRQLIHIINEIGLVHEQVNTSFSVIGDEVQGLNSILRESELQVSGQEVGIGGLTSSLMAALQELSHQLSLGQQMTGQISSTAHKTRDVSESLVDLMDGVGEMHDQIRLQAVNTLIMANNLGEQGRTIQVLAREINLLSDKTSDLFNEVDGLQTNVRQKLDILCQVGKGKAVSDDADVHASMMINLKNSYRKIEEGVDAIPHQVVAATHRVNDVQSDLLFMDELQEGLEAVADMIEQLRDSLVPWKDNAAHGNEEIERINQRYTMQKERTIHSVNQLEEEAFLQDEEGVFF